MISHGTRLILGLLMLLSWGLLASEGYWSSVVSCRFAGRGGQVQDWREDDWCKGGGRFGAGSPVQMRCVGKQSILVHVKRFAVKPGERLRGRFQGSGTAKLGFCLYVYDQAKRFIGSECPRGVYDELDDESVTEFSLRVPKSCKGRKPAYGALVLDFRKGCELSLGRIELEQWMSSERLLRCGGLTVELTPDRGSISALRLRGGVSLTNRIGAHWYARGQWQSQEVGARPWVIRKQTSTVLEASGGCFDFDLEKRYELKSSPEAVKLDYRLTVRRDFFIGGGDPPGGISIPSIRPDKAFTHWLKMSDDGSLRVLGRGDFPPYERGYFPGEYLVGRCTPDGKRGYFLLLDSRFYKTMSQVPFLTGYGICQSQLAYRQLKRGDVVRVQVYLVPFDGNASQVAAQAIRSFCPSVPEERGLPDRRYESYERTHPVTFGRLRENGHLGLFGGQTEMVLPHQAMPERPMSCVRLAGARREQVYGQLVIRPKVPLKKVRFTTDMPESMSLEINYLETVPSRFAATSYGMRGAFPDIVAPMGMRTLSPGANHPYLVSIAIKADATAGVHGGRLTLHAEGMEAVDIPFEVTVFDFALPVRSFYRTAFLLWTGSGYQDAFDSDAYRQDHRALRITAPVEISIPCDSQGNISPSALDTVKRRVQEALAAGDTCYRFADIFDWRALKIKDKTSKEAEVFIKNYMRGLAGALREIGVLKDAWILMYDETHWGAELNNRHIQWCKWVREVAPDLPLFSTQNHPLLALAKTVDIVCGSNSSMEVLRKTFGDSKEYWLYENGFYFALGQSEMVPRSLPWRSLRGGYAGYHQWCSTFWGKGYQPGHAHGTGAFYYPPEFGDGKPVRSYRLIHFSQGVADYDYIRLLENEIDRCKSLSGKEAATEATEIERKLHAMLNAMVPDAYTFTATMAEVQQQRLQLGRWLETLRRY